MEGKILQILNNCQRDILANSKLQDFQWLRKDIYQGILKYQNSEITFKEENRFFQHQQYQWLWYKNLNIPTYSYVVTLQNEVEQKPQEQQLDIESLNLTMELHAFQEPDSINHLSLDKPSFQFIRLLGNTMVKVEDNTTLISGVKFMDTSFNEKYFQMILNDFKMEDIKQFDIYTINEMFQQTRKCENAERQYFSCFSLFQFICQIEIKS